MEKWITEVNDKMGQYNVSRVELAKEAHRSRAWVSGILRGAYNYKDDAQDNIESALDRIIARRGIDSNEPVERLSYNEKLRAFLSNTTPDNLLAMMEHDSLLTVDEVAEVMGICVPTAREYMKRPDFPRISCGKKWFVSRTALFIYNLAG